jgi:hypothetical protein
MEKAKILRNLDVALLLMVIFVIPSPGKACLGRLHLYTDLDVTSLQIEGLHSNWSRYPSSLQVDPLKAPQVVGVPDVEFKSFAKDHIKLLTNNTKTDYVIFRLPTKQKLDDIGAIYFLLNTYNTFDYDKEIGEIELIFADGTSLTSSEFPGLKLKVGVNVSDIWAGTSPHWHWTTVTSPNAINVWNDGSSFLNMLKIEVADENQYASLSDWNTYKSKDLLQIKITAKRVFKLISSWPSPTVTAFGVPLWR